MKFSEYPSVTKLTDDQIMLVDGTTGTRKIQAKTAVLAGLELTNAINKRNIFRGKNLGSSFTSAQKAAIQNGTFEDLWLGDYWVIDGVTWRIVDFDYWYGTGDVKTLNHHLIIMPDSALYDAQMNTSATTASGYSGCNLRVTGLSTAATKIKAAFGAENILAHREYLTTTVTGGIPTAGAWKETNVEIPSEIMMYGCPIYSAMNTGDGTVPHMATNARTQLALFRIAPEFININKIYWLRDVVNATQFARVYSTGIAQCYSANTTIGVRPVFAVG